MSTTATAELFTVREVARRRLRVHPASVYRSIDRGELPAIRLGPIDGTGPLRIRADELEAALEQRRVRPEEAA